MPVKLTTREVLIKFCRVHGDKYDYSKVEYVKTHDKVCIICPEHGEFWQTPNSHLQNSGCPTCGRISMSNKNKLSENNLIESFRERHGLRYDYKFVEYKGINHPVKIVCKEHGYFMQTPHVHRNSQGCPKCSLLNSKKKTSKTILEKKFEGLIQPEDHKLIPLTRGKFAKVDNEDFDKVRGFNWHTNSKNGYAYNNIAGMMHRFIMNCPDDKVVDHINHDTLDNRKKNLRCCYLINNSWNSKPIKNSTSKYKGVWWSNKERKWLSVIGKGGKKYNIGSFNIEEEAAKAYDKKAVELFGEFAYLNFPELKDEYYNTQFVIIR